MIGMKMLLDETLEKMGPLEKELTQRMHETQAVAAPMDVIKRHFEAFLAEYYYS